jgi:hypothetical protein
VPVPHQKNGETQFRGHSMWHTCICIGVLVRSRQMLNILAFGTHDLHMAASSLLSDAIYIYLTTRSFWCLGRVVEWAQIEDTTLHEESPTNECTWCRPAHAWQGT